jgi:hypothetical protein
MYNRWPRRKSSRRATLLGLRLKKLAFERWMGQNLMLHLGAGWTSFRQEGGDVVRNTLILNKNNLAWFEINFIQPHIEKML